MTVMDAPPPSATTAERAPRGPRLRAAGGWAVLAVLVLVGVFVAIQVGVQMPSQRGSLDPESVGDSGTGALAQILDEQGVEVEVVRSRAAVAAAVDDDTTLVMANPYTLTDEGIAELLAPAQRVVFLSTGTHLLNVLGIGDNAAPDSAAVAANCEAAEFADVGSIRPDRLFTPAEGVQGCFGAEPSDAAAVLIDEREGATRIVVEGARLFSNAYLAEDGNAALALALLGQTDRIVWYVPSLGDTDIESSTPDTLGSLTPEWVTPAILLLILAGLAAAVWRGQRFGPLVAETLPVTVRASETMHGRARLTAKAGDARHAAEAILDGSRRRLARRLGLAATATPEEIADAASDRLRIPRGALHQLLGGEPPSDDASLVELARRLDDLEGAVDRSTAALGKAE